jgi:hypothetical protein
MECSYRQRPWAVTREARDGREKRDVARLASQLVWPVSRGGFRILLVQLTGDGVGLKAASCR